VEPVEGGGKAERCREREHALEGPALVALDREALGEACRRGGRIGSTRPDVEHDLVRRVERERREHPRLFGTASSTSGPRLTISHLALPSLTAGNR
jgi:hypothetical protein